MKFAKGKDKIVGFRNAPDATFVRTYTSCCNTCLICNGGAGFPVHFRPLNPNAISVAATGEKFEPKFVARINGKTCNQDFWATVAEDGIPKDDGVPGGVFATFLAHVLFAFAYPGPGEYADDKEIVGINSNPGDFAEITPLATFQSLGFKLDQPLPAES